MRNFIRIFCLSLVEAVLIILMLIFIVKLKLPMSGVYTAFGVTAVLFPLVLTLIYIRLFEVDTLIVVPVSLIMAAAYSFAVSLYSAYGSSGFSNMFQGYLYFIYFLPSIIYCGVSWCISAIIAKMTRSSRR